MREEHGSKRLRTPSQAMQARVDAANEQDIHRSLCGVCEVMGKPHQLEMVNALTWWMMCLSMIRLCRIVSINDTRE